MPNKIKLMKEINFSFFAEKKLISIKKSFVQIELITYSTDT